MNRQQLRRLRKLTGIADLTTDDLRAVMVRSWMVEDHPNEAAACDAEPDNARTLMIATRLAEVEEALAR